jgi:adenylate kinase
MILDWLPGQLPSISTGEMLRAEIARGTALGERTKGIIAAGGLVGDDLINKMLAERIRQADCEQGFMLDGYPRTPEQARFLDAQLDQLGMPEPVVIHLDVPADVLVNRMISRRQCTGCGMMFNIMSKRPKKPGRCDACSSPLMVRRDDREEVIRERLRTYDAQTQPVLRHYRDRNYIHIPGEGSPDAIFEAITGALAPAVSRMPHAATCVA